MMSNAAVLPVFSPVSIPVREILPWLLFGLLMMLALYFVGAEEGATSIIPGMYVHEFVHDGRHLLGFPATRARARRMVGSLLVRGMLAGLLAGLLAFGVARILGEPPVDLAIAFEEQAHKVAHPGHEHQDEPELVSREMQRGLGLFTGVVVYATAFGGLFALVFAFAHGRIGNLSPRATSALLAAAAFVVLVIVPDIKYPPNPPAIGESETIGLRTALFVGMIAASIAAMLLALAMGRSLVTRLGVWNASLAGGGIFILLAITAQILLPAINEVPERFPAAVLWQFRVTSIGIEAVLWATIGLVFGPLAEAVLRRAQKGQWSHQRA
jgi:Probable cobalt transporter subunit (CbtA)